MKIDRTSYLVCVASCPQSLHSTAPNSYRGVLLDECFFFVCLFFPLIFSSVEALRVAKSINCILPAQTKIHCTNCATNIFSILGPWVAAALSSISQQIGEFFWISRPWVGTGDEICSRADSSDHHIPIWLTFWLHQISVVVDRYQPTIVPELKQKNPFFLTFPLGPLLCPLSTPLHLLLCLFPTALLR